MTSERETQGVKGNRPFLVALATAAVLGGVLGGTFAGGVVYGKSLGEEAALAAAATQQRTAAQAAPTPSPAAGPGGATSLQGTFSQGLAGGGVAGTVERIDGSTVTIATLQGSVTATLDSSTQFQKLSTTTGSVQDLQPGARVQVAGQRATDGTVAARMVIITTGALPQRGAFGGQDPSGGQQRPGGRFGGTGGTPTPAG